MKTILKRRPSPAMVVALIALVVASSGTAIAGASLMNGDKVIKKGSLSGNRLRSHTITGAQVNLSKLGKVPTARRADLATNSALFGGKRVNAFVGVCTAGSVAATGVWYAPALPADPTYVAPNRYGGEGGFACNGGTIQITKESTGWFRMRVTPALPGNHVYVAYINADARSATPLYGDANSAFAGPVWDVHVFNSAGTATDPYYLDVLLVAVS